MPIYLIESKLHPKEPVKNQRLVRAPNQAQALRHVASEFNVNVATQEQLVDLVHKGVNVESVSAESAAPDKLPTEPVAE